MSEPTAPTPATVHTPDEAAETAEPDRGVGPVLVVGCGLLGTSVGLSLRRVGIEVHLRDLRPAHVELAVSLGAGSASVPTRVRTVVVAVPPDHVGRVVAEALAEWPEAVVTDVGSVKAAPLRTVLDSGADASRYVGGHPMAGSERSGPVAASAQLFDGRAWAVCTGPGVRADAVATVEELARLAGAFVVPMTPDEHDRAVARVSHLPHLLSVLAAARLDGSPDLHLALAGQGLRDVTRIAASDPRMWRQILRGNAEAVTGLLRDVRTDLDLMIGTLETDAAGSLESVGSSAGGGAADAAGPMVVDDDVVRVMEQAVRGTRAIPDKHGGLAPAYASVFVQLPDRAGQLAALFSDTGESGVNVEDLRIDHAPGAPVGVAEIIVSADHAEALIEALQRRDWVAYR